MFVSKSTSSIFFSLHTLLILMIAFESHPTAAAAADKQLDLFEMKSLLEQFEALPLTEANMVSAYLESDFRNDDIAAGFTKLKRILSLFNAVNSNQNSEQIPSSQSHHLIDNLSEDEVTSSSLPAQRQHAARLVNKRGRRKQQQSKHK